MNKTKPPGQYRPFLTMFKYTLKAYLRNRSATFFGFVFPIVFVSVFGLIGEGGSTVTLGIPPQYQKGPVYQAMSSIKAIKIESSDQDKLEQKLQQGRIAGVLLNDDTGLNPKLEINQASPQQAGTISGLVSAVVDKVNVGMSGLTNPPIKLELKETSGRKYRYIDFALPGVIGFALLSSAMFGSAFVLVSLRKTLVIKRIFATPVKGSTILLGMAGSRLVIALLQTLVILGFGVLAFQFTLVHGLLTLLNVLILSVLGLVTFLGFGILVGGIAPNEDSVPAVSNVITLPQFLLSGSFFPSDSLPGWIQPVANSLPLSFFNTAMRKITVEGLSFMDILPYLAGILVWSIIAYAIAARTFKWD